MFDPDDEEPTSPQIVQDIIASLDAEEEHRSVGYALAAAGRTSDAGTKTAGALIASENVARRKLDEDADKRVLEGVNKESAVNVGMKTVRGVVNVVSSKTHDKYRETCKALSERADASHSVKCKKPDVQNVERVGTIDKCSPISVSSVTTKPNRVTTSLKASEPSQNALTNCIVNKVNNDSIVLNELVSHVQSNEYVKAKVAAEGVNDDQRLATHTQVSALSGVVAEATKHTCSKDGGKSGVLRTSEVLIQKQCNPIAPLAAPISSNIKTTPTSASVSASSLVRNSVQTSSLSMEVKQAVNRRHSPCYASSLGAKEKTRTSTAVEGSPLVSSSKSSKSSDRHPNEKVIHGLKEKASDSSDVCRLNVPLPASETVAASCRTTLKIPKAQHTIHDITKPTIAQLPKQKHAPVPAVTKPHLFAAHNARFQANTAPKRCHEESVVPAKRVKIQQDGLTTPLDLSNPSKKTVAADSTSMLSRSPVPSPKPKLPKLKTGKSQNIHSIVDSLANREHISLKAVPTESLPQTKKLSNRFNDSRLTEEPRKRSSPHVNSKDIPRKGPSQNPKTMTATPRKPSHFSPPPVTVSSPMSPHRPLPMSLPTPESASCYFPPGSLCSPPLHVDTGLASRLSYDMAMRNLLTLSHMAMAQGGMVRPPHMLPMQPMFPPRPKSHDFHPIPDPSLLRQQSEVRMGAASKKASPTAGTTAPQLRTPTGPTSASIQHMEDLTRTVYKRADRERHSVTVTPLPFKG